jgi:diacylglycerol kinase family enzyme/membrane-associated phospholipid phosphatase
VGQSRSALPDRIAAVDRAVMRRVAHSDFRLLDLVMPRLSRLADHGVLWTGLAFGLWATGDRRARRAAWRGIGSLLAASAIANIAGKGLTARSRPEIRVPPARRLPRTPRTTSFPSGHAAAAAAFATGVALEKPGLAIPVVVLAAAVGASRVLTGVHYPSDVLAGFTVGTAAGAATLRWWPRRPSAPAAALRPQHAAPVASAGENVALVINMSAGTASSRLVGRLRAELPRAVIIETSAGQALTDQLRGAASKARVLGVAGGDGTVSTACAVAVEAGLPLLVIPAGTFNHFAGDLGVWSVEDALAALRAGEAVLVDIGVAGQRPFINTSSTGIYVDLVHARRRLEPALGRQVAAVVALIQVLRRGRPHELILDGRPLRLWLYFAGNCRYEPTGTAPAYRPDLCDGYLDIRVVEARLLARSRLVAAVLTGTVRRCRVYGEWRATQVTVASADGVPVWLSVDGEVAAVEPGFTQAKRPHGLLVYRPAGNAAAGMPPAAPLWLRKLRSDALHVVRTSVLARLVRRGTAPDPTASAGDPISRRRRPSAGSRAQPDTAGRHRPG